MGTHDLLHSALNRHAAASLSATRSPPSLSGLALSDDEDQIDVRTPLPSAPGTPALSRGSTPSSSRSSSPTRRSKGGAGKPRRDKTKEREKAEANKASMDPLGKFPGEINGRIFGELRVDDLLSCGLVCKRWRKSQTMNYLWYLAYEAIQAPENRSPSYAESPGLPTWRRADSKEDWAARFAAIHRVEEVDSDEEEEGVDEEGVTMREEREAKWKEENEGREMEAGDKVAMRQYYKSLRNSKVKGKSGKGSVRTWEGDGLAGGGMDDGI